MRGSQGSVGAGSEAAESPLPHLPHTELGVPGFTALQLGIYPFVAI